ncbi:unnamed protein product [Lampetra fluviatilis]
MTEQSALLLRRQLAGEDDNDDNDDEKEEEIPPPLASEFFVIKRRGPRRAGELNRNPVEGFSAGLIEDEDIYHWEVVIIGSQDTI